MNRANQLVQTDPAPRSTESTFTWPPSTLNPVWLVGCSGGGGLCISFIALFRVLLSVLRAPSVLSCWRTNVTVAVGAVTGLAGAVGKPVAAAARRAVLPSRCCAGPRKGCARLHALKSAALPCRDGDFEGAKRTLRWGLFFTGAQVFLQHRLHPRGACWGWRDLPAGRSSPWSC